MNVLKTSVLGFMFSCPVVMVAQNEEKLPDFFNKEDATKIEQLQVTNTVLIDNASQARLLNSNVFLKQYGDINQANIINNTFSTQRVVQYGNKNYYQYQDFSFNSSVSLGVFQLGNKNSLEVFGANSIFNGTKVIQTGGSKIKVNNF